MTRVLSAARQNDFDFWLSKPGARAVGALGRFGRFVAAKFKAALAAGGGSDARSIFGVLQAAQEVQEVRGDVLWRFSDLARDLSDGKRMIQEQRDEVASKHYSTCNRARRIS